MRIFLSNGMCHHHEQRIFDLAIGSPTLLPVLNTIFDRHEERIAKDFAGVFKADAVLALIGEVLGLVPFKTDPAHYNSIITNTQLCNQEPLWHNCAGWEIR